MTSPCSDVTCSAAPVRWRRSWPPTAPPRRQRSLTGGCPKRNWGRCCRWFHSARTGSPGSWRGPNPVYGYSPFNYVLSAHMGEYHTTERVLSFLLELERAGLNTWQASWSERLENDWLKYKDQGGKLQVLLL